MSSRIELLGLLHATEVAEYLQRVLKAVPGASPEFRVGADSEVNVNRFASRDPRAIVDRWERKNLFLVNNAMANLDGKAFQIPGHLNPSDAASRCIYMGEVEFSVSIAWFNQERAIKPKVFPLEQKTKFP
jgi:hypothetical protein